MSGPTGDNPDVPPRLEDAVACFCGHGMSDHDEYGPCDRCSCRAFVGCLVIGGRR